MVALSPIVSMALSAAAAAAIPPYTCTDLVVPVNITAQTTQLNLDAPSNPIELTGLITRLVSATSNVTAEVIGGKTTLTASYSISSQLCVPADFPQNGTLEFAIHG